MTIRAQSLFDIEDLDQRILVRGPAHSKKQSRVENGKIIIEVAELGDSTFGEDFVIQARNGGSLKDAITPPGTSNFRTDAIVEILDCK